MLRTASSLPLYRAFDAGLRPRPFPGETASLLPGLLAATRTGLPPAGDDELTNSKIRCYVTASPPALLGARIIEANVSCGAQRPVQPAQLSPTSLHMKPIRMPSASASAETFMASCPLVRIPEPPAGHHERLHGGSRSA